MLLTVLVWLPVLHNGFVEWDDLLVLVNNPMVRGLNAESLRWMWTTFHMGHYTPLAWMSIGLDAVLGGLRPFFVHGVSLLWHAANGAAVAWLAGRLLPREWSRTAVWVGALVAGLFFALHPLRVESVAWATQRRDVLGAFFLLVATSCYVEAASSPNAGRWRLAAWTSFLISLLAKSLGMVFPAVLLVLDVHMGRPRREGWPVVLREKIGFVLPALAAAVVAASAQSITGAAVPLADHGVWDRLIQGGWGFAYLLGKTAWPTGLTPIVEIPAAITWSHLSISLLGFLAVSCAWAMGWRWSAPRSAVWAALAFFLPTSGIFQSGPQYVADRYSYLWSVPWALCVGGGIARGWDLVPRRLRWLMGVGLVLVLAVLSVMTRRQIGYWADSERLWSRVLAVDPSSRRARFILAAQARDAGRWEEAERGYRALAAEGRKDSRAEALVCLGHIAFLRGDVGVAQTIFREALILDPRQPEALNNLARLALGRGAWAEAAEWSGRALATRPDFVPARVSHGTAMLRLGRIEEGEADFFRAVGQPVPTLEAYAGWTAAAAQRGDLAEARHRHHRMTVLFSPTDPTVVNLGNALRE
jgi:Flp pilus assembly protein TadD